MKLFEWNDDTYDNQFWGFAETVEEARAQVLAEIDKYHGPYRNETHTRMAKIVSGEPKVHEQPCGFIFHFGD